MTSANWRAAGAALESLDRLSVLLLIGDSTVSLAAAVRGAADAAAATRRVAIFDLAGAFGQNESDGLVSAFREGRSLNALARPLSDGDENRFIVPRGPGAIDDAFAQHERWPRLVGGFRDTGAMLIIAAPSGIDALDAISQLADRSLRLLERDDVCHLVEWPPSDAGLFADVELEPRETAPTTVDLMSESQPTDFAPLAIADDTSAAQITDDEPPAIPAAASVADDEKSARGSQAARPDRASRKSPPPLVRITPASSVSRIRARRRVSRIALAVLLALAVGGWYWSRGRGAAAVPPPSRALSANGTVSPIPDSAFVLPDLVNPEDSAHSAAWGVELVATNDRLDAISRLAGNTSLSAATISPVLLGADAVTWYKVIVGAYLDRAGAEYLRATLRQGGAIDPDAGVVARAPYALRLEHAVSGDAAKARVVRYVARGVAAYALVDDSARASVYAGAFASPDQAVILLAELRAAGLDPALAYRVGRAF